MSIADHLQEVMDHAGYMRCPEPFALEQLFKMNWEATLPAALRGDDVNRKLIVLDASMRWYLISGNGSNQLRTWTFRSEEDGDITDLVYPVQVRGVSH